jgi:hypothetical protein
MFNIYILAVTQCSHSTVWFFLSRSFCRVRATTRHSGCRLRHDQRKRRCDAVQEQACASRFALALALVSAHTRSRVAHTRSCVAFALRRTHSIHSHVITMSFAHLCHCSSFTPASYYVVNSLDAQPRTYPLAPLCVSCSGGEGCV